MITEKQHKEGFGIVEIGGFYRAGKTATMIAIAINEVAIFQNYSYDKVISNVSIPELRVKGVKHSDIMKFLTDMVSNEYRNYLILWDEADQAVGHRGYTKSDRECLTNLWQISKLGNTLIYTDHIGLGVDAILRDSTMMSIFPYIDKANNKIELTVIDANICQVYQQTIRGFNFVVSNYDRFEAVKK